jgi:CubicO group peptidase (beta-lactamase class C family)
MITMRLPRTTEVIQAGMEASLHWGAQVAVSRQGQFVAELALGKVQPGKPLLRDSLMLWLSSTKPVVAAAVLQLAERGRVDLEDPVVRYIPEFAPRGKDCVTLRHLLTHTAGLRWVDLGWPQTTWQQIIARLCAAKMERDWKPGQKGGYHPFTTWYLLGEVIQRVAHTPLRDYVREEILLPLQMNDCWLGLPIEQYPSYSERLAWMPSTEKEPATQHRYTTPQAATDCVPGASLFGPACQFIHFYEMLIGHGTRGGKQILSPESVRLMATRQREGMRDQTFMRVVDWGLGTIINSARYGQLETLPYNYGEFASDGTYGHSGSQSSTAFADPEYGLAVAVVFNGLPGEARHTQRMRKTLDALYRDLGLAAKTN